MFTVSISSKAVILRGDTIMLVECFDPNSNPDHHYNLPGGKLSRGRGLRDTLASKVETETGLDIVVRHLLLVVEYLPSAFDYEYGDVQKVQLNFLARERSRREPRMPDVPDPEQIGLKWIPVDTLTEVPLLPRIAEPLQNALAMGTAASLIDRW